MKRGWTLFALFALFALLAVGALSPYLATGYYQDDSINCLLPTYLDERHLTIGTFIRQSIGHWVFEEARLFPLTLAASYSVWYWIRDLGLYRAFQVSLVVGNLLLFAAWILELGGGPRLAVLASTIVLGLFQLRDFHDPVASYAGLMQIAFALGLGTLWFWLRYEKTSARWQLAASWLCYAAALLFYEAELVFAPLVLGWTLASQKPRASRWGHGAITLAYLAAVALLRLHYPRAYAGTEGLLRLKALGTFAFQLSAALPLSYPIFGRSGFYDLGTLASAELWSGAAALVLGTTFALLGPGLGRLPPQPLAPAAESRLRRAGWLLLVAPAALVALSAKYQDQVTRPGIGYLPVYFSCFGLALLVALGLRETRRWQLASAAVACLVAFNFSTNRIAAERLNRYWKYPREALERALDQGLLADLRPGDALVLDTVYNWATPDLFLRHAGVVPRLTYRWEYVRGNHPAGERSWLLGGLPEDRGHGSIRISPIERIEGDRLIARAASREFRF